ncbi:hypothetical protein FRB93_000927 [Tulasnella sp. JGI-2019a]|nr:hypothetical protein FRB93_000927 [Tulasnella sp. JGI-2019a]
MNVVPSLLKKLYTISRDTGEGEISRQHEKLCVGDSPDFYSAQNVRSNSDHYDSNTKSEVFSDEVTPPPRAFELPYDVLTLISENCLRHTLLDLCLVNRSLHAIATKQLYKDPFDLLRDELRDNREERWFDLCRVISGNADLAGHVRSFTYLPLRYNRKSVAAEESTLPCLKNLTAVRWRYSSVVLVDRFVKYCPSSSIRSIMLPRRMDRQLRQPFWTWLRTQTKVKELFLPWNCTPILPDLSLFTFPNLENLAAGPEVTKELLPTLKSIRTFCGQSVVDYSSSFVWSLEDLERVLQQFGEGLDSIRGVAVLGRDVIPLLRLLRARCPFVKTVYFDIDSRSIGLGPPSISSDNVIAALHSFLYLEELLLTVDYEAGEETRAATCAKIVQGCLKLRFVQLWSYTRPYLNRRVSRTVLIDSHLVNGSWLHF